MKRPGIVVAAALAIAGSAAAAEWHVRPAPDGATEVITDLAVSGEEVVAAGHEVGAGAAWVRAVSFAVDSPPVVGLREAMPYVPGVAQTPRLAYDGVTLLMVAGNPEVHRRTGAGWDLAPAPLTGFESADDVGLDPLGGGAGIVVKNATAGFTSQNIAVTGNSGATWTNSALAVGDRRFGDVAVIGTSAIVLPLELGLDPEGTSDIAGLWTLLGPLVDAASITVTGDMASHRFVAAGAAGIYATATSATGPLTPASDPTAPNFLRVAAFGTEVWLADDQGRVHRTGPLAAPVWPAPEALPTGVPDIRALAVIDADRVLVTGTDGAGQGVYAWRNRAPTVTAPAGPIVVDPNGAGVSATAVATDPDGETPAASWSCDPAVGFAPTGPLTATITLTATCGTRICSVTASDGSATSAPDTFDVTADDGPPVLGAIALTPPSPVFIGQTVDAQLTSAVDGCPTLTYQWDVLDGPTSLANGTGPVFGFTAPATPKVYTVQVVVTDVDGYTAVQTTTLTVEPPPEVTLACPASFTEGTSAQLTAVETAASGPLDTIDWTVTPANAFAVTATSSGAMNETLSLTFAACSHGTTLDIQAVPTGPSGAGAPAQCSVPIVPPPGGTPPTADSHDPDPAELELAPSGGRLTIDVPLTDCGHETITYEFRPGDLPAELWPSVGTDGALGPGASQAVAVVGAARLTLDIAARDVAAWLSPAGARSVLLELHAGDDAGTPLQWRRDIPLDIVPEAAALATLEVLDPRSVALGDLVVLEARFSGNVEVPALTAELDAQGFVPMPDSVRATPEACVASVTETDRGWTLEITGIAGAQCETTLVARRGLGAGRFDLSCTVPGEPIACDASVIVAAPAAVGCSAAGGTATPAMLLALLALARRRRA